MDIGDGGRADALISTYPTPMVQRIPQERRAHLSMTLQPSGASETEIRRHLERAGVRVLATRRVHYEDGIPRDLEFDVREPRMRTGIDAPEALVRLATLPGVIELMWHREA